jgi:MinD-like ATPase involved in chromosome partitioning or flagellar assembly
VLRSAVAIALPRDEFVAVSAALSEAGFESIEVHSAKELEAVMTTRSDVGLAILDSENAFEETLEMYAILHEDGRSTPSLMAVAPRAMDRMRLAGQASSKDEYFTRPYLAESLRWRVEAILIRMDASNGTSIGPIFNDEVPVAEPAEDLHGRVVVIFNPKGGVGKTTIAMNLAAAMQLLEGQSVLLIDCDTVTGHIAPSLGMERPRTVVAAWTENLNTGVEESFADIALRHSSGVSVLVLSQSPLHTQVLEPRRIAEAITAARSSFNWVFVDMHPDYGPLNQGIFTLADRIIVPVTPDVPCLRAAVQFADVAVELNIRERLALVVNRANSGVSVSDVERVVRMTAVARVRSAGMLFMRASNEGQSAVERFPTAKVVGDIKALAEWLTDTMNPSGAKMGSGLIRVLNRAWARRKPGRSRSRHTARTVVV